MGRVCSKKRKHRRSNMAYAAHASYLHRTKSREAAKESSPSAPHPQRCGNTPQERKKKLREEESIGGREEGEK